MSSRSLVGLSAPAKLNLFLHVTGRRPDGYHTLQSVFMRIDWQDTLDFTLRKDATITRRDTGTTSPLPADDLCVRAAHTLQQATGCSMTVTVTAGHRRTTLADHSLHPIGVLVEAAAANLLWQRRRFFTVKMNFILTL